MVPAQALRAVAASAAVVLSGCAPTAGPPAVTVPPGAYPAAFHAATEVAREFGFSPRLRDVRAGLLETEPEIAPTVLEPWRMEHATARQALESTLNFQRRRLRFEFRPLGPDTEPAPGTQPPGTPAPGPVAPGPAVSDAPAGPIDPNAPGPLGGELPPDLTRHAGPIQLVVWAPIERQYDPGRRVSTWSRRLTTETILLDDRGERIEPHWITVARDPALERRVLAALEAALARTEDTAEVADDGEE